MGQNTWRPQVRGRKVYFNSQFAEVSVRTWLAPRQVAWQRDNAEEQQSRQGRQKGTDSSLPSPFVPSWLQAFWVVPPGLRMRPSIVHTQKYDGPVSKLMRYGTPWIPDHSPSPHSHSPGLPSFNKLHLWPHRAWEKSMSHNNVFYLHYKIHDFYLFSVTS